MSCLSDDSLSHMIDHPSRTHFTYTSTLLQRDIALNQNASSLVPQFLNMNVASGGIKASLKMDGSNGISRESFEIMRFEKQKSLFLSLNYR